MSKANDFRSLKVGRGSGQPAFTLLELLIVISLIGLIAGVVSVRMSSLSHRARLTFAIDRFIAADSMTRSHATRHGKPASMIFNLGSGTLSQVRQEDNSTVDLGSVQVAQLITPTQTVHQGPVTIPYSPYGTTPTYALMLKNQGGAEAWLLVAGATGQIVRLEKKADVEAAFAMLEEVRTHAR